MILIDKLKSKFFWIPSVLMVIDIILMFFHISLWNDLSVFGLQDKAVWLGIIGLCCLVIFLLPHTLIPGFFLLCCYWGGAIVTGLIYHSFNLFPVCMLGLFAIAAYWRDCSNNIKLNSYNLNQ